MILTTKSRWILLAALIPLTVVSFYLVVVPVPEDRSPVRLVNVTFIGQTDDPPGRRRPAFAVSNLTSAKVMCTMVGTQTRSTNVVRRRGTNVWDGNWVLAPGWTNLVLRPGDVAVFTAQRGMVREPWRYCVFAEEPMPIWQPTAEKLMPYLPTAVASILRRHYRRTQWTPSPVFEPIEPAEDIRR